MVVPPEVLVAETCSNFWRAELGACLHLDLAICNVVRSKIDGIFSSVTIVDYLSEHLEFDGSAEIFWTLRNRASGLLDLVAHHAKLLDAFQQLASLRNHAWYMFRYRAVLGLSAWMNEREDVRQYILELASAGDSNIEFLILDILEPRVATDEMSCSALISLASRTVNSSMTPYYAAQRLVSHISSVPRVKEFFLRLFEDESVEFARRQLAACALSEIAEQDSDLLPLLVPWLGARTAQNHPDGRQLRRSLANNIGRAIGDRAHTRVSPFWMAVHSTPLSTKSRSPGRAGSAKLPLTLLAAQRRGEAEPGRGAASDKRA
jgi:hypothetical protein